MIESQIRELFTGIAGGEPEISRVDAELARRRGRARLRWRWAAAAGTPLLAAATAVAVVVTVGLAPAHPRPGTAATGNGPAAPRQFNPLVPYLSFGWLPKGVTLVSGGTRRTVVSIEAGRKPYSAHGWDLNVYAAGQCHLTPATKTLKCGTARSAGPGTKIVGPAPAVRGHRAWWAGSSRMWWADANLVWQYARNGWAWLFLPNMYRYSPQQMEAVKRDAVKIADHIRYGAPTLPLVFPAQLTHLPRNWRVSSVFYLRDGGVLRARSYALAASRPSLGADGGLDYQSGLPYFTIDPATRRFSCSGYLRWPGSVSQTINGYRVVITHDMAGSTPKQQLCAAHADGLDLFVSELGSHRAIGVASLFRSHLRLLGGNPANWTRNPIG
jgi:hypothetical protein